MSRRSRRRDASINRKRKVDRPRLLKQAKTNAVLRPVALAILGVGVVAGGAIIATSGAVLLGAIIAMSAAFLTGALWWSSTLSCPACGTALEVDGARGLFVPPTTVTCTKCRVIGHPKSTLPKAMQKDRPAPKSVRKHQKRRDAVARAKPNDETPD